MAMKLAPSTGPIRATTVPVRAKGWELTSEAFNKLLTFLDADRDLAGLKYVTLYGRLTKFFEWRGSAAPDASADETINRVARKIDQGAMVTNFKGFLYGVARNVLIEALREMEKRQTI